VKSNEYPNDRLIDVLLPCGKTKKKLESDVLNVVCGWIPHEIRVMQEARKNKSKVRDDRKKQVIADVESCQ